ncbi:MAG: hypothetical protein IKH46_14785 [Lachnospiraceae bacterium]|nr:hypothetical protein [Lachnospiraceae bacterium]
MSVLQASDLKQRLSKYYKRLDKFNETAKSKSEGDEYKYLKYFINFWSYSCASDEEIEALCIDTLKSSLKEKNYSLMQATMHFLNKTDLLWHSNNGCDHSYMAYHIVKYLSSAEYNNLYRAFPKGLSLAANGHTMNVHAANLILCLLYNDDYERDKVVEKARKYIISKQPRWDRAFVACILGTLEHDTELLSENLQVVCETLSKTDVTAFEKLQCQFAYGLLAIAYNNMPPEEFASIRLPEYKNFDPEYLKWLIKGEFTEENLIEFGKPYEILNTVISAPVSHTLVFQPYLNEDVPARQKKQFFMDCDKMNDELIQYVMKASQGNSSLI